MYPNTLHIVKAVIIKNLKCSKIISFESVRPLFNISIDANIADPDQTAPIGAARSGSTLFAKEASKCFSIQQEHATFVICALGTNRYTARTFMK